MPLEAANERATPRPEAAPAEPPAEALENHGEQRPAPERKPREAEPAITKPSPLPRPKKAYTPPPRDEITVRVEKILEEGLTDSFRRLSPVARQEFKMKGEQTAAQIRELLKAAHVKVKKIFRLILDWLRMLPGINRFFLEQEAKIKTDRIVALKRKD